MLHHRIIHIFIPTILLLALFRKEERVFCAFLQKLSNKNKTEVTLGFCVYLRRREPFLRSAA